MSSWILDRINLLRNESEMRQRKTVIDEGHLNVFPRNVGCVVVFLAVYK